jgi:hypothetical protein
MVMVRLNRVTTRYDPRLYQTHAQLPLTLPSRRPTYDTITSGAHHRSQTSSLPA